MKDDAFLAKLKRKDQGAWREAYTRYYPKTEAFLRTIKYPLSTIKEDAKDIWQETMIVLYTHLDKGTQFDDLGAYIYGIIKNKALKKLQEKSKKTQITDNILAEDENEYERLCIFHEITQDVLKSMEGKKGLKHCVNIIRWFFLERKKDREISQLMDLKEEYIRVRRSKTCLPHFKEAFKKHYKYPDLTN